jgi:hypothetical protein
VHNLCSVKIRVNFRYEVFPPRRPTSIAEARRLSHDDRFSTIARLKATQHVGSAKVRLLFDQTYFAGLRRAGMAEN